MPFPYLSKCHWATWVPLCSPMDWKHVHLGGRAPGFLQIVDTVTGRIQLPALSFLLIGVPQAIRLIN